MEKIFLILENGKTFEGNSIGAYHDTVGEIVFTTAMTGYLETLTDPSYYGQIVVHTFPLIGNYGVIPSDFESPSPSLKAYIVRELCQEPSNFRNEGVLDTFLRDNDIVGISGIDTRELTKIIREYGVMNAAIVTDQKNLDSALIRAKSFKIGNSVAAVSLKNQPDDSIQSDNKIVLWDFGAKGNIKRELEKRGYKVVCMSYDSTAEQIIAEKPCGIMLSNGPGDPAENTSIISELKKLSAYKIPTFGICLGHQLLALSQGAVTEKLKYGHRGANQPVKDILTDRVYVTSQNHGYAVTVSSLPENAKLSFINVNDNTCEGVTYTDMPAFSVQFHPEACGGPRDTDFLFDRFDSMIKESM